MAFWIPALMAAASIGSNLIQGNQNKKQAERQRKQDIRQQAMRDMISIASGQGAAQTMPLTQAPANNLGASIGAGVSTAMPFIESQMQQDYLKSQAEINQSNLLERDRANNLAAMERTTEAGKYRGQPRMSSSLTNGRVIDFEPMARGEASWREPSPLSGMSSNLSGSSYANDPETLRRLWMLNQGQSF